MLKKLKDYLKNTEKLFEKSINYLKNIDGILVELGVGTGRIACTLVEEYHKNIIGIDTSEEMLALASKKISMNHCGGNIRLIKENMLEPLDKSNIPNFANIMDKFKSSEYDPGSKYSVPYTWGTVGIIYNVQKLEELGVPAPTKWSDLWDERLKGEILMQDSVRDAFMVALKELGYSMNTTDVGELEEAKKLLLAQKPLVQAYVVDQVRDKMLNGEAAVGVIYSGELLYLQEEAETLDLDYDLEYVLPKEGTNLWIDSWVIPDNAKNKENAEKWINFLCRPDIALKNFEYITYSTPNKGAFELLDEDMQNNKAVFPDIDSIKNAEVLKYLGDDVDELYNEAWKEVKSK